jgi:hypothetical protein
MTDEPKPLGWRLQRDAWRQEIKRLEALLSKTGDPSDHEAFALAAPAVPVEAVPAPGAFERACQHCEVHGIDIEPEVLDGILNAALAAAAPSAASVPSPKEPTEPSVTSDEAMRQAIVRTWNINYVDVTAADIAAWRSGKAKHERVIAAPTEAAASVGGEADMHAIVSGALFDLLGGLTSGEKEYHFSGHHAAGPAVEAITAFAKLRGLRTDEADVGNWSKRLSKAVCARFE